METKINTNAIPDGGIDIEKLKAGIVPDISHLETKEDASAKLQEAKDYTDTKVAGLIDSAPETLNTLKEVADAIQENETVVDALNSAIGNKANSSDVYNKQEVDDKIDAIPTTTFQYAANESEVPAERVPGVVYLVGNEIAYTFEFLSDFYSIMKNGQDNIDCKTNCESLDVFNEFFKFVYDDSFIKSIDTEMLITDGLINLYTSGENGITTLQCVRIADNFIIDSIEIEVYD